VRGLRQDVPARDRDASEILLNLRAKKHSMSKQIKPLSLQMISALTVIHGAMELGLYDQSLAACETTQRIASQLVVEIEKIIKERHDNEVKAILAMMPRNGALR
jgi:hypothetical protein